MAGFSCKARAAELPLTSPHPSTHIPQRRKASPSTSSISLAPSPARGSCGICGRPGCARPYGISITGFPISCRGGPWASRRKDGLRAGEGTRPYGWVFPGTGEKCRGWPLRRVVCPHGKSKRRAGSSRPTQCAANVGIAQRKNAGHHVGAAALVGPP